MALPTTYKYHCGGDCGLGSDNPDDFAQCDRCREEQGIDVPTLCHEICLTEHASLVLCRRHYNAATSIAPITCEGGVMEMNAAMAELVDLRTQIKRTRECLRRGLARADVTNTRNLGLDGTTVWPTVTGRLEGAMLCALDASGGREAGDEFLVTPRAKETDDGK